MGQCLSRRPHYYLLLYDFAIVGVTLINYVNDF